MDMYIRMYDELKNDDVWIIGDFSFCNKKNVVVKKICT